jgi:hypothetical protein
MESIIEKNAENEMAYFRSNLSFSSSNYIAKAKPLFPENDFALFMGDGAFKYRAVIDKGMELAVFAAGIDVFGKIDQKVPVKASTSKFLIEDICVNTGDSGLEPGVDEVMSQFGGVDFPNRENRLHVYPGELVLAVLFEIFEEDVAESDFADAQVKIFLQDRKHLLFVIVIGGFFGNKDFFKRQAQRFGLPSENRRSYPVHAPAGVLYGWRWNCPCRR